MIRFLTFLVLLVAWQPRVEAASFRMKGDTIHMRGQIVASDPLHLSRLIDRGARKIVLQSPGGLVAAASYMSRMIRSARLTTVVREECASACTIMFYAGARRELTGRLGFHAATDATGTADYAAEMRRYGAPSTVVDAILKTPPDRIVWVH